MKGECQHLKHYKGEYKEYNPRSIFSYKATVDYFYYKDKQANKIYQNKYVLEVRDLIVDSLIRLTLCGNFNNNLKDGAWITIHHDVRLSVTDTILGYFINVVRTGVWMYSKGIQAQFINNYLTGNISYTSEQYDARETINFTIFNNALSGIHERQFDDYESETRYFKGYKYYIYNKDLKTGEVLRRSIVDTNIINSLIKDLELKKFDQQSPYTYSNKYEDDKLNIYSIYYSSNDQKYYKVWQINSISRLDDLYSLATTFDIERGSAKFTLPYLYHIEEYNPK